MALFLSVQAANACTNFIITKGASVDGSTMISYAADSHVLYGELYHWAAATYPAGTMLDVYDWDSGRYMGKIPQVDSTWNVIGNMNQWQLAIGETTYGGLEGMADSTAIMDYGSLIYITLQRAKTAREAIYTIVKLVEEFGYFSAGESFSIADPNEAWIFEIIGKGVKMVTDKKGQTYNANKGALWVARRVPDGYVSGHANQARITTFPLAGKKVINSITSKELDKIFNPEVETAYADDLITFSKANGFYDGPDEKFSFSDVYNPVTFDGARFCDLRVWTMFNKVTDNMDQYWGYATGRDIKRVKPYVEGQPQTPENFPTNRMPLWVLPKGKVSVEDMFGFMRDHLEGTELDMSKDIGAGPFECPYRWRPMTWSVDGVDYIHERCVATQQTGFSFVSQSRSWMPIQLGGIIWWGVDDADGTVYCPMYTCMTKVPFCFAQGNGSMSVFSETSGFWIFNQVTNLAYTKYNLIHPEIAAKQYAYEHNWVTKEIPNNDKTVQLLMNSDPKLAVEYLTQFSNKQAEILVNDWKNFYKELFVKYLDGNLNKPNKKPDGYQYYPIDSQHPKYSEEFYRIIIEKTGDQLKVY
ncbi:MAG: C69 family dipeptidase [Bacteroidales bacterium]|nr:C69 family dipeptidase [Bacteroidales bacterium]